ncbi:hypothetical protein LDDCCGHA_2795 [Methylobacterium oxalidis]|nr:hypothetical protein LDDCCGHA_2795 [Methylobacterium oxalidis]
MAGDGLEILHRGQRQAPLAGGRGDRLGDRVLRAGLDAGGERQHLGLVHPRRRHEVGEARAPLGERAGLVEGDRAHAAQSLQRGPVAEQHAALGRAAGADHDRGRRREAHRAGAGDDEDRDGVDEGVAERRLGAERQPGQEGRGGDRHHGGHEAAGDAVDERLDRELGPLGRLHHPHDLGERRIGADALHAQVEPAGAVQRAADRRRARRLADRRGLARDHALVDEARPRHDRAVRRDALARADPHDVADPEGVEGDLGLGTVAQDAGGLRREAEEAGDGLPRAALGARLQEAAEQDQGDDEDARLEVEMRAARRQEVGRERRDEGVEVGRPGPEGDEGVHVGVPAHQARHAAGEEAPAGPREDERRERGLDERQGPLRDEPRQRVVEAGHEVAAHVEDDDRQRQERGGPEVAPQAGRLRFVPVGGRRRLGRGHRPCRVTRGLDRGHKVGRTDEPFGVAHPRLGRGEVDAGARDAGDCGERPLDAADAGGAGETLDAQHRLGLGHRVARGGDGLGERARCRLRPERQAGAARREIDGDVARAREGQERALDPADAGGAGQAGDGEAEGARAGNGCRRRL